MPTRSGLEYLLPRTIDPNMSVSDYDTYNIGPRTVLVVYAVGQTQYTKLLLDDIYDVDKQLMMEESYELIVRPMSLLTKQMMNGYHSAKCDALEEAIGRQDADIYLRGSDGIDIAVGRTQSELQASVRQLTIATLSNDTLQIVIKIHGFKAKRNDDESSVSDDNASNDSLKEDAIKFTGRYNASQFVQTRTSISKSDVKRKPTIKKEKQEADDEKGEANSMEDRLNSKDFHKIASIKLASRDETPEWYDILVAHGEMCGVFVPPLNSIIPGSIMGRYWSKKLLGETINGRHRTMESNVHKLLLTDGLFSKDCDEEYRDIVKESSDNGYAALNNILRSHHPRLTDKKVETKIPAQSVGTRFGRHVCAVQDHLFREETRGRIYSKYEALQLVIDTLHPAYHLDLKFGAEKEFDQTHYLKIASHSNYKCPNWEPLLPRGPVRCAYRRRSPLVLW
jgi:hypothetical protein